MADQLGTDVDGGRENMPAAIPATDPASHPTGTVVVHPDDDRNSPTARRRIAVDDSTHAGPYKGCRWERLTGGGIHDGGCDPIHSDAVVGWPVQPLAELAVALGHPKAKLPVDLAVVYGYELGQRDTTAVADPVRDVRQRAIAALSELVSEFISPDEFGGYDVHYGELVDVVLAEVQPELDHLGTYKETAPVLAAMVDDLRAELRRRNRAYGRASETIGHLRAEQAHYREKLRIAHEAIERATRHRAAAQGIVMYVVDTLGLPVNTVGDAAAIGQALRELKSELARQRESRLAWAIEADRLDVIATEACLVTHPRECGRDESDCTNDDSCPRAEERYATADDLIGAMALSEEVAQLTRERDDAREELTSFYSTTRGLAGMFWADPEDHQALDALSDIRRQLAAWRADATQVPEGWQSLVRKGWSVGARPAIPTDATYVESLKDDLALAGDEASAFRNLLSSIWLYVSWRSVTKRLTTEQKELWADAIEASGDPDEPTEVDRWWRDVAPMSGSDTATEDGEDDWGKDRLLQGPASSSGRDGDTTADGAGR